MTRLTRSTRSRGTRHGVLATALAGLLLALPGCAGFGNFGNDPGVTTVTFASVNNPQMQDLAQLIVEFEREHPDIRINTLMMEENDLRNAVTKDVATEGGQYDVMTVGLYEVPIWGQNKWLVDLTDLAREDPSYDVDDIFTPVLDGVSYQDRYYAMPFYGESSFLAYRADLFEEAGLEMPERPTWDDVRELAAELNAPQDDFSGICLRGLAGWGEVMAPMTTAINTFGGGWFDEDWNATLDSPETREAVETYIDTVQQYGQPGAATSGFGDCLTRFAQGQAAMWYDATSMVSTVEDPASSTVAGKVGYAPAPVADTGSAGWLYSWSLAIPSTSEHKDAAWDFVSWMTDKDYLRLVGEEIGWERVPPGSRLSTYEIPEYAEVSQAYADATLDSMNGATQESAMTHPVPYPGIQFVGIPEFQDLGTRVGQQMSAAIAGQVSIDEAVAQSQRYADTVAETYRAQEEQ